jgi:hypothetical protein
MTSARPSPKPPFGVCLFTAAASCNIGHEIAWHPTMSPIAPAPLLVRHARLPDGREDIDVLAEGGRISAVAPR